MKFNRDKINWLLDATAFDTYHDELADAIIRYCDNVVSLTHPDPPYHWIDIQGRIRSTFPKAARVITHGDISLVRMVLANSDWVPGAFATVANFRCSSYYPFFQSHLLNRQHRMLRFDQLNDQSEILFREFGRDGRLFIRPDSPLKLFTGTEIGRETWSRDLDYLSIHDFPPETLVLVSSPQDIETEWRFLVADRKVIDGSMCKHQGMLRAERSSDAQALDLAKRICAAPYQPDPFGFLISAKRRTASTPYLRLGDSVFRVFMPATKTWLSKRFLA